MCGHRAKDHTKAGLKTISVSLVRLPMMHLVVLIKMFTMIAMIPRLFLLKLNKLGD
jgi:hypothetical protein